MLHAHEEKKSKEDFFFPKHEAKKEDKSWKRKTYDISCVIFRLE